MDENLVINTGATLICLALAVGWPERLILGLPLFLGWFFPFVAGTVWSPYKIAAVFATAVVLRWASRGSLRSPQAPWAFILASALSTFVNYFHYGNLSIASYTAASDARLRSPIQLFWALLAIAISMALAHAVRSRASATPVLRSLIIGAALLALTGLYDLVANVLGLPTRRIWYAPGKTGVGEFASGVDTVSRVVGLTSEPKQLAKFVLLALVLILTHRTLAKSQKPLHNFLIILLSVVLIATYSTSAWAAAIVVFTVSPIVLGSQTGIRRSAKFLLALSAVAIAASLVAIAVLGFDGFSSAIYARTEGRRGEEMQEYLMLEVLASQPQALLFGFGPGNFSYELIQVQGFSGYLPTLDSGWLIAVCDYGIIGTGIVLLFLLRLLLRLLRMARTSASPHLRTEASVVAIGLFCCMVQHAFVTMWDPLWMLSGCAQGLLALSQNLPPPPSRS